MCKMRQLFDLYDHPIRAALLSGAIAGLLGPLCWLGMRLGNCPGEFSRHALQLVGLAIVFPLVMGAGFTLMVSWIMRVAAVRRSGDKPAALGASRAARNGAIAGAVIAFFATSLMTVGLAIGDCMPV